MMSFSANILCSALGLWHCALAIGNVYCLLRSVKGQTDGALSPVLQILRWRRIVKLKVTSCNFMCAVKIISYPSMGDECTKYYAGSKFGDNFTSRIPKLPELYIKKVMQPRTITNGGDEATKLREGDVVLASQNRGENHGQTTRHHERRYGGIGRANEWRHGNGLCNNNCLCKDVVAHDDVSVVCYSGLHVLPTPGKGEVESNGRDRIFWKSGPSCGRENSLRGQISRRRMLQRKRKLYL